MAGLRGGPVDRLTGPPVYLILSNASFPIA
jgi:hypothetical protein